MDKFEYEIKAKITEYLSKHGKLIYLTKKDGTEIARVVPVEGCDLFDLREDYATERDDLQRDI